MLRNILVQFYLFLQPLIGAGQSLSADEVAHLPNGLNEASGMAFIGENAIAMINDGGNEAELFIVDTLGNLIMRPKLVGLANRDWESLCYAKGRLYIGDFGNNNNSRQNLEVLVLDISRLLSHEEWSLKGRIPFSYADQEAFPPIESSEWYFDLEAMVYHNDSLFLFTKNRTKPFDGLVRVYAISTKLKSQEAQYIKSFKTEVGLKHFNWVAGASIGPNGDDLFLLGYNKLWYVSNWRNSSEIKAFPFSLGYFSQKEALACANNQIYFSEEKTKGQSPKLHKVSVEVFNNQYRHLMDEVLRLPTQKVASDKVLRITFKDPHHFIGSNYRIYNTSGIEVLKGEFTSEMLMRPELEIDLATLMPGRYVFSLSGQIKKAFAIQVL